MADEQKTAAPAAAPATTPAPAAPAAKVPVFSPKVGALVQITETDKKHADQPVVSLLLVTAVGSTTAAKIDPKTKKTVTEDKEFTTGNGKVVRTVAVLETVETFDGILFSAQRQLPEPRRGVLIDALSPLEA